MIKKLITWIKRKLSRDLLTEDWIKRQCWKKIKKIDFEDWIDNSDGTFSKTIDIQYENNNNYRQGVIKLKQ